MVRRTQEGYSPFKDDKPKDTENSPFEASSVLVVKASVKPLTVFEKRFSSTFLKEAMLAGGKRLSPTESKMRPGIEQSEDD